MIVLAEIGDKMPSALSTLIVSMAISAFGLVLARVKWWLALVAVPVFGFWNWLVYSELHESVFGQQILTELGPGYVAARFMCINIPALIGAWIVLRCRSTQIRRRRIAKGLCEKCAYPRSGTQTCPECGNCAIQ